MSVLIDTNILICVALGVDNVPYQAYVKATSYPNHGLICEQDVDEMRKEEIILLKGKGSVARYTRNSESSLKLSFL